ncbi:MAG: hypothetical protein ACI81V_000883 [Lentimonas sp.]|jgi:hypothetical protein
MKVIKDLYRSHHWKFSRQGGIFQVQLNSADDLQALSQLDPKLWVALSCPVEGLEIDSKTLALIDADQDGRVRIEEMLNAVRWTLERLARPESLLRGGELPLDAINTQDAEGQALLASAEQILANVGDENPISISVEEAANTAMIYGQSRFNGDGVIAMDATDGTASRQVMREIIDCLGAVQDRNNCPGISLAKLNQFFGELKNYQLWWTRGEVDCAEGADVFPLGEQTPTSFAHFLAIERKIDDFFARTQLAAFDPRAQGPLNRETALYHSIAESDLSGPSNRIEALPLAQISADAALPLTSRINPEWTQRIHAFRTHVVEPLKVGSAETLQPGEWKQIQQRFADYRKWREAKPSTGIEKLGITRIRQLLASDLQNELTELLKDDLALAPKMKSVDSVEKLARFHRDLLQVLNNFVNFSDFYDETKSAIFQAGTLYLDGRECRLCLRVNDPNKHAALASLSRAFIAYCECRRKDSPNTFHIAAVFSAGDSSNLIVGRNGVFRDGSRTLWDTTITKIIQNPISIREGFLLPYQRVGQFISDQLETWASSRDQAIQKQLESGLKDIASDGDPKARNNNSSGIGSVAGMIAAGGIALGAIGAGLASLFNTLQKLTWWEFPIVVMGLILMISLPSMFIAWLKIRKRTLAPLLDASGWAVNGRTLISFKLGRLLTTRATLPLGSHCQFDERRKVRPLIWVLLGATAIASALGWLFLFS